MKPRYYQFDRMINPAIKAFQNGSKSTLIVAPTGAGKTAVAAWWAQQAAKKGRYVLVITHKNTIQRQMLETFYHFGIARGAIASGRNITSENVQIAMIGTLINKLDSIPVPDWIIVDEGQHLREINMWGKMFRHYQKKNPDLKSILLTATPNGRVDGLGLHPFADTLVNELSTQYLVDEGWLVYPHTMIGEKIDTPKFHITGGDYDKKEQKEHFKKKHVIGSAIENYQQYMDGMPIIVSCVSLDHAHFMQEQYTKAAREKRKSWKAVMIQGGKKYEKQMVDALAGFATGSVQVISFVDVLGEGVDVPYCLGIQIMRKMRSLVLYLQFIGRTLRPVWPEWFDQHSSTVEQRLDVIKSSLKPMARIQDFAGNYEEHKHPISPRNWTLLDTRIKEKRGDQMVMPEVSVCPKCSGVWPGLPKLCPDCGHNLQEDRDRAEGRTPPKEIEGILREVLPEGTPDGQMQALIDQALRIQQMTPGERQKAMMSNLYKYGKTDRNKGLATALGYHKNWTETIYHRVIRKGR